MWCLALDAVALGVDSGWVMVSVGGEVVARVGGDSSGRVRPCHEGPLTDLYLHDSHLLTLGGDGWLRIWEAETLDEAVLRVTGGMEETLGWCEPGIKTICLQLVRKLPVHSGPGYPVTITPTTTPITTTMSTSTPTTTPNTPPTTTPSLVWVIQTNTGVVYGVWAGQWTVRTLHQGPSGRVTGVAMASTRGYLATTTHHRYLQVTALLQ
ncbi:uncharacterized protein LOC121880419, partial [Homarus americanus]|uniref:uncharacterized protein LOC121880419 n=1 Tax=Homarus americanus TaxID=6706 RepID=UPI001C46BAA7